MNYQSTFQNNRVTNPAQSEVTRQRLYDYQLYPAAGATQLNFFSAAIGNGIATALGSVVGSTKSQWDTNMTLGGQLPSGMQFLVQSIEVLFLPGSVSTANTYTPAATQFFAAAAALTVMAAANDVNIFYQSGILEFNILQKNYLRETPLLAFPPKAHLEYSGAVASNSATTSQNGAQLNKAGGRPYWLDPEITLQPAVNFEVLIKYPAAVAMPSTFNGRVGVILDGLTMRASQ